jgi:hypothetical protein
MPVTSGESARRSQKATVKGSGGNGETKTKIFDRDTPCLDFRGHLLQPGRGVSPAESLTARPIRLELGLFFLAVQDEQRVEEVLNQALVKKLMLELILVRPESLVAGLLALATLDHRPG